MVLLVANARLFKDRRGNYYSDGIYGDAFFYRYTSVFGRIMFVAKIDRNADETKLEEKEHVDTACVEIVELPDFRNKSDLARNLVKVISILKEAVRKSDRLILRMFQLEGFLCWFFRGHRDYAVEVINNVKTSSRYHGLIRYIFIHFQMMIINRAAAVFYVTGHSLQEYFPYKGNGIQGACSDIELTENFISSPKTYDEIQNSEVIEIVNVANSISENSKGHFTILEVISMLKCRGIHVKCTFVGDGPSVNAIITKSKEMGIEENIEFVGYITNKYQLMQEIRSKDIFVFPSQSEGMPRCLIEACAAGLPCIASRVGGIPEIIPSRYLFDANDIEGFAGAIERLSHSPSELHQMSVENVYTAKKYSKGYLDVIRRELYLQYRDLQDD